jgi:lambda family phage portal protein
MNAIDRLISYVDPVAGARRIAARRALDLHARAYDAARRDPRTLSWQAAGSSANAEISTSEEVVRNRCRSLVRDNGYARQIVQTVADHVVGTGIVGAPMGVRGRNLTRIADGWAAWVDACDFDGDHDLNGLMWSAVNGMEESGAALIRFHRMPFDATTGIAPLRLQLLEPDFIDVMKYGTTESGGFIDRGIEYDALGRKVAFWLYRHHPGDTARFRNWTLVSDRIPADEIVYLYDKLRPGQDRGMPLMAPAVMTLRDLDGYFQAELTRKRIESCLAGFITTDEADGLPISTEDNRAKDGLTFGKLVDRFEPGMLMRLRHGEDIKIATPANSQGVAEFAQIYLREAAAGSGVMYEHATGDFSNVNYSSWRAGHHGFRRRMERKQWHVAVHKMCRPIIARYRQAALAAGLLPVQNFDWRWTPPGFISVDPYKDAQADLANLRMGKVTLSQLVEERGNDYASFLAQYAADLAAADAALGGAMFDGDPRKVIQAKGTAQAETDPPTKAAPAA